MLETKLTLNGVEYTLAYDWEAQVRAEEMTGMNLLAPAPSSAGFRGLFLARLLKHHPDMTLDEVSTLIPMNIGKISTVLHNIGENQDDQEEDQEKDVVIQENEVILEEVHAEH